MDIEAKNKARRTLERLGVRVHRSAGRPPRGLAPDEEIWVLGEGPAAPRVLVTPLRRIDHGPRGVVPGTGRVGLPRVWVAEHVPPPEAQRLIAAGEAFVDGVGNAYLHLPELILHVLGHKPTHRAEVVREEPAAREWRGPALRALFPLLCDPVLVQRPYRDIAAAANTAPGTIVHLLRDLEDLGHLVRLDGRHRRFVPTDALVARWVDEYGRKLRPRLLLGRFEALEEEWWRTFVPPEHRAQWGGETAAALLGAPLRPLTHTLYCHEPIGGLLRAARLRPDPAGRVEIREIFWNEAATTPRADVTHPLLVVADLRATRDGRCHEAARQIEEEHLAGLLGRG